MTINPVLENVEKAFIEIGYKRALIQKDYEYTDLFSSDMPVRTVGRAIFGQAPMDYRSACFGVYVASPGTSSAIIADHLKALGAPQIFIVLNGFAERWQITAKDPVLQEKYETSKLHNLIITNKQNWKPESIMRAKAGFARPAAQQLDFIDLGLLPALEYEAGKKIDYLLQVILNNTEDDYKKQGLRFHAPSVFKIVFSFLAAKLLKDRNISNSENIDFSLPKTALEAVRGHYGAKRRQR